MSSKGIGQGCTVSPVLFNIYTYDIHSFVERFSNVEAYQYADDIALVIKSNKNDNTETRINNFLNTFVDLLKDLHLNVNESKTIFINFKNKLEIRPKFIIKNKIIEEKTSTKFLGVQFDNKLNFKLNTKTLIENIGKKSNIFKMLNSGKTHMFNLLNIYKSTIQSIIDFNSVAISMNKTNINKLNSAQL
jgi:hypothetical protein